MPLQTAGRQPLVRRRVCSAAGVRRSLKLAALVFVHYALLAFDIRFVAHQHDLGVAITNVRIATNTWYITNGVVEAHTVRDRMFFMFGGATGARVTVWLTRSG